MELRTDFERLAEIRRVYRERFDPYNVTDDERVARAMRGWRDYKRWAGSEIMLRLPASQRVEALVMLGNKSLVRADKLGLSAKRMLASIRKQERIWLASHPGRYHPSDLDVEEWFFNAVMDELMVYEYGVVVHEGGERFEPSRWEFTQYGLKARMTDKGWGWYVG